MTPLFTEGKNTSTSFPETYIENEAVSYSAPLFREPKSSNASSFVPPKAIFSRNIDSMLSHRLGDNWKQLSTHFNVPCEVVKSLSQKYLSVDYYEFQEEEHNEEGDYYEAYSNPNIVNLIQELLLSLKDNKITLDDLIESLSQYDKYLAYCINVERSIMACPEENSTGVFTSYIFTLWIKNPNRGLTNWGSFLPNTEILPHQQVVFDWAFLNPDKLVVLWYDSESLTESDKRDLHIYQDLVSPCLSNLKILDIRDIEFNNNLLHYEEVSPKGNIRKIFFLTPNEALNKEDSLVAFQPHIKPSRLGIKIDFLRQRLMYEGSSAIESALAKTRQGCTTSTRIPCKGVWFDLDYIPQKFSSSLWSGSDIFIDDSTCALKPSIDGNGQVTKSRCFMQSLLAVRQDKLDILGSCLWVECDDPTTPSYYMSALEKSLFTFRHRLGGVRGFKMRTVPSYQGDFIPGFWSGPNSSTYSSSYNSQIDKQTNMPLNTRRAEIVIAKKLSTAT